MHSKRVFITFFTLFLMGFSLFSYFLLYPLCKYVWGKSEIYHIQKIASTCPSQDRVKSLYLQEVLGLSLEKKESLYHFNQKKEGHKLAQLPIFARAEIYKVKPNILFVDYALRQPLAYVADFANTVVDAEGVLFPFVPFYSPKVLPEIYYGKESFVFGEEGVWGGHLEASKKTLAQEILALFPPFSVRWLDLASLEATSLGKREIVMEIYENGNKIFLRLTPKNCRQEIANYLKLKEKGLSLLPEGSIIDLRLPKMALIKHG